jgi:hypothetical protein
MSRGRSFKRVFSSWDKSPSSTSKTDTKIENNTVNQNFSNTLNETTLQSAVSALINSQATCQSTSTQSNICTISNVTVSGNKGPVTIGGGTQSNNATSEFKCVSISNAQQSMNTAMTNAFSEQIKALSNTTDMNKLNDAAESSTKQGSLSTSSGSSSSSTNSDTKNNTTNTTITNLTNKFSQSLTSNFTSNNLQECINGLIQDNTYAVGTVNAFNNENTLTIGCGDQTNTLSQVSNCSLLSSAINTAISDTFNSIGLKVETDNTTLHNTEATSNASSSLTQTGIIQDFGDAISKVVSSIGGIFSGLFNSGDSSSYISISCCICCLLIISLIVFMVINKKNLNKF